MNMMRRFTHAVALLLAVCSPAAGQGPRTHTLKAAPDTVHWGYYDATLKPVLTVRSSDMLVVETMLTGARFLRSLGVAEEFIRAEMAEVDRRVKQEGPHLLLGPVEVEGAAPGDTLEVRVLEAQAGDSYALNVFSPGHGVLSERYPYQRARIVPLDLARNVALFAPGIEVPLAPFFGSIGVAPPQTAGRIGSRPPGYHGGNLDNKWLVAGSTLFLPVHVQGALLSIGDGHVAQGDGEVDGTALEAALRGRLQIVVRKDMKISWPRAETADAVFTMGFHTDLDEAARLATEQMVDYIVETRGLERDSAYMLASAAVDLHITQMVSGIRGVHARLPKRIFDRK
jgi:acetamidase/formamidase